MWSDAVPRRRISATCSSVSPQSRSRSTSALTVPCCISRLFSPAVVRFISSEARSASSSASWATSSSGLYM